jgi:hypothetical protein
MGSKRASDKKAHHLLKKLIYVAGGSVASSHQWLWEGERWKELVFALLAQVSTVGEDAVREIADELYQLDLLDVETLAGLRRKGRGDESTAGRIIAIMREGGIGKDEAALGLASICDAASGLVANHSGKIQFYFRAHAQRMVKDAQKVFGLSAMKEHEARMAITYWLQNVLNMPLSLQDKTINTFAGEHGVTGAALYAAADELDLNVALLDDLVAEAHTASVIANLVQLDDLKPVTTSAPGRSKRPKLAKRATQRSGGRHGR